MNSYIISIFSFSITTFIIGMMIFPYFIEMLKKYKIGKQMREEALMGKAIEFLKLHNKKIGTPTMGGAIIILIVFLMVFSSIILEYMGITNHSLFSRKETYLSLFTLGFIGLVGAADDYMNIKSIGRTKGLSARLKMVLLIIFATVGAWWFYDKLDWSIRSLNIPFIGYIEIGLWFIPLFIFIIIATANSVNITDGLDGLAGGLLLFCYGVYGYITYDRGMYLLSTLCAAIVGVLCAFLWYNIKPAKVYMGDVGSLALGANLGIMAMLTNTVFVLIIIGAIFIFETISVIIQITSKKLRKGKKVFKIAPFHHHLEAIGRNEETVVFRLWLVGVILSAIGIIVYNIQKTGLL